MTKWLSLCLILATLALGVAGCGSSEDNPITPDKMEQIRQKEGQDRGNFAPPTNTPKPTGG